MRRRALIFREHNLRSRMMRRVWRTCGGSPARRFFAGEMRKRFAVDRTALDNSFGFNEDQESESISPVKKEPLTALGKDLQSYIKLKGPITLHDYMAQSLNHMIHGYYQSKHEVIGEQGDFITAPEVSQLFGEMLGIWCMSMWEQMGRPAKINLVELGPGKGTLMKDILRVAAKFGSFRNAVSVHLVELSLSLRVQQYEALDCTGGRGVNAGSSAAGATGVSIKDKQCYRTERDIPVHWNSFLYQVPDDVPSLIIGQEFLDAFPVHQFTYTEQGWREKLVDVNSGPSSVSNKPVVPTGNQRIAAAKAAVLARKAGADTAAPHTAAPASVAAPDSINSAGDADAAKYHFRMVLSPNITPAVRSLLGNQSREKSNTSSGAQAHGTVASNPSGDAAHAAPVLSTVRPSPNVGDGLEVSPLAIATCEDIARRVVRSGGAALLVDYGENFTQEDSLRAFQKHKQVNVLSQPGVVDVTADVDFSICRTAAERRGAKVMPLLTQGQFLMRMGIVDRVQQLMEADDTTEAEANALMSSLRFLVETDQMGERFKVMSIANPALTSVVGFES